jgi:ferredoxin
MGEKTMRLSIDEDKCIGCGRCEEICPSVFHVDEQLGLSRVVDEEGCEYAGCCEAAAENCPVEAITYEP